MKNEKTVTLTLTETQFGFLFNAYIDRIDSVLCSENLTDEDKKESIEDMKSTGIVLWNALPVFFPFDSLVRQQIMNIDWGYYEGYHDEPQS
jgi:hypothetical protein